MILKLQRHFLFLTEQEFLKDFSSPASVCPGATLETFRVENGTTLTGVFVLHSSKPYRHVVRVKQQHAPTCVRSCWPRRTMFGVVKHRTSHYGMRATLSLRKIREGWNCRFQKHPAQKVETRSRQCRPKVPNRLVSEILEFAAFRGSGTFFQQCSRNFPGVFLGDPEQTLKQPQPSRVLWVKHRPGMLQDPLSS